MSEAGTSVALIGSATLIAYWAQENNRSGLLWFFFGLVLLPVACVALLVLNGRKHEQARASASGEADPGSPHLLALHKDFP